MESPLELPPLDLETAKSLSRDAVDMMRAGKNDSALVLLHNVEGFLRRVGEDIVVSKLAETVYANIGGCYLNSGDSTRAVKYLRKAVGFSSGVHQAPALVNLSLAHFRLGDYEAALQESTRAIRLYESAPRSAHEDRMHLHAKALLVVAMCQEASGNSQKALISYFKALCFAIEKLPPDDDIRLTINDRYEALLTRSRPGFKGKESTLASAIPLIRPTPKLRLRSQPRKSKTLTKTDLASNMPLAKPAKNPALHLKPQKPSSTRPAVHLKAAYSHEYSMYENTNSTSLLDVKQPLSHRSKGTEEQLSMSALFENSDVEDRIMSIGEKLEGLTMKLREYGDQNRLMELKAEGKGSLSPSDPSKSATQEFEPRGKRCLFRVNSLSKVFPRTPQAKLAVKKADGKYSMYRFS